MQPEQLNLQGVPDRPKLGPVQELVYAELLRVGTLYRDEAGALVHAHRGKHPAGARCAWCAIDGRPVLASLVRRSLAEKGPEGAVQLPRRQERQEPQDGIPY